MKTLTITSIAEIGKVLRAEREKQHLTRNDIPGVSRNNLYLIETNQIIPGIGKILNIASVLGYDAVVFTVLASQCDNCLFKDDNHNSCILNNDLTKLCFDYKKEGDEK